MEHYSVIVKGNEPQAVHAAVTHGAIIYCVHAGLETETVLIVDSPLLNLQEWLAEDIAANPPFDIGSLLYFRSLEASEARTAENTAYGPRLDSYMRSFE
jgi:hypothetical protein